MGDEQLRRTLKRHGGGPIHTVAWVILMVLTGVLGAGATVEAVSAALRGLL